MQIFINDNANFNKEIIFAKRAQTIEGIFFKNVLLNESADFVSLQLPLTKGFTPQFGVKGFFLHSSLELKIKSVPVFMFSLQRRETMETYISCFYVENSPGLFEALNNSKNVAGDHAFFFN